MHSEASAGTRHGIHAALLAKLKLFVRAFLDRYRVLRGREEAAAITLYGLFALFALTVLAIAVVGFIATDDYDVAQHIVDGLGLHGSAAKIVIDAVETAQKSRGPRPSSASWV